MNFAIIKTGGKQYKVKTGDILKVEKLSQSDKKIIFDDIMFGGKVTATIIEDAKAPKIVIRKHHAKKRYNKVQGHRQTLTQIVIDEIK